MKRKKKVKIKYDEIIWISATDFRNILNGLDVLLLKLHNKALEAEGEGQLMWTRKYEDAVETFDKFMDAMMDGKHIAKLEDDET